MKENDSLIQIADDFVRFIEKFSDDNCRFTELQKKSNHRNLRLDFKPVERLLHAAGFNNAVVWTCSETERISGVKGLSPFLVTEPPGSSYSEATIWLDDVLTSATIDLNRLGKSIVEARTRVESALGLRRAVMPGEQAKRLAEK